eukprot:9154987-Pyramimonas_sp.AAC.1
MLSSPSVPGQAGQPQWGVAILVRKSLGLRWPTDGSGTIVPSRIIKAVVDIPAWPPLTVVCAYLKSGTGLCESNLGMLQKIGLHLEKEHLFLVGTDWNMEPSLVDST